MNFFELKIALRYITGKKEKNKFVSFISLMSMLGIILGVATLIIVVSLLNGFKYETVNNVLEKTIHVKLLGQHPEREKIIEYTKKKNNVAEVSDNIVAPSLFFLNNTYSEIYIVGLEENVNQFKSLKEHKEEFNKLNKNDFSVLLSDKYKDLFKEGDNISLVAPELNFTPVGSIPRSRNFKVIGFLDSNIMKQKGFDDNTAYMNIDISKKLLRMENNILLWELKDFWKAKDFKEELSNTFNLKNNKELITWEEVNKDLLSILKIEKLMTFIILMLIILVAAFNLVSSLVMTVNEKRGEIAILRTLGCKKKSILALFMIQGSFVGIVGTIIGVIIGILISLNIMEIIYCIQGILKIDFLDDFLNNIKLSSIILVSDIFLITFFSLFLSIIVTIYPSFAATKIHPAEALKNE